MPRSNQSIRYKRLRELLVVARRSAGLLQAELSDRLGRPQSFVSKYERGEKYLDVIEFIEVAGAIGCSAEDIVATLKAMPAEGEGPDRHPRHCVRPG